MKLKPHRSQISGLAVLLFLTTIAGSAQGTSSNSWKIIGPGGGGTTYFPTISPHDSRFVVEHCDMTGDYITRDDGLSWRMINLREWIAAFAFDPEDSHVLYAANAALWRSSNSGRTFRMIFPNPSRNTIEHDTGDRANYSLTTSDPAYPGGDITALAIVPPENPKDGKKSQERIYLAFQPSGHATIVPGADGAVIVSSADGGASWSRIATLPHHVVLLTTRNTGVIAVSGSAAYRIAENGAVTELGSVATAFRQASAAQSGGALWIYATGQDGKVYLSEDAGLHWKSVTPEFHQTAGNFEAIATSEFHPAVAYAGFRGLQLGEGKENFFNGIAKTTDSGRTWKIVFKESNKPAANLRTTWIEERATQGGRNIWFDAPDSLGVAPTNPDVAYATDLFRTYRTLDGGTTWQDMDSRRASDDSWISRGLNVTTNYGVQFDPFDSRHIYMDNTDIGLFQSSDGGRSWRSSTEGVPESWRNTTYWLAFDPAKRGLIWGAFSGTHDLPHPKMWRGRGTRHFTGGVAVSTDGGNHWTPSSDGIPTHSITHILLDPSSPAGRRTLYACAFGLGVYKSTDNGKSWARKNDGIAGDEPLAWRITLSQDGSLYLVVSRRNEGFNRSLAGEGALYRSTDKAEHWQRIDLPAGVTGPTGLEVDPRDPQHLYLTAWGQMGETADYGGGVFASENGGKTWKALYTKTQHVYDLTIDPRHPDTLYFTGSDTAAYRSTDDGAHWVRIEGYDFKQGNRIFIDPNNPSQIYITTYGGGVWHGPATGAPNPPEADLTPVPIAQ